MVMDCLFDRLDCYHLFATLLYANMDRATLGQDIQCVQPGQKEPKLDRSVKSNGQHNSPKQPKEENKQKENLKSESLKVGIPFLG